MKCAGLRLRVASIVRVYFPKGLCWPTTFAVRSSNKQADPPAEELHPGPTGPNEMPVNVAWDTDSVCISFSPSAIAAAFAASSSNAARVTRSMASLITRCLINPPCVVLAFRPSSAAKPQNNSAAYGRIAAPHHRGRRTSSLRIAMPFPSIFVQSLVLSLEQTGRFICLASYYPCCQFEQRSDSGWPPICVAHRAAPRHLEITRIEAFGDQS
jgi:hypothetical protein